MRFMISFVVAAVLATAAHAEGAGEVAALAPLSSIHVQGGGKVVLSHGGTVAIQASKTLNITVDAAGRMTVGPCDPRDCQTVTVTSPNVPALLVSDGGVIDVDEGFPDQATGSAAIKNGGLINMLEVTVQSGAAAIKQGGQIMIHATDSLTADVKGGGNILYGGAATVKSHVKDGGWVFSLGEW